MLQQVIINTLETTEKNRKGQQKNSNENFRIQKYSNKKTDGLNSRMQGERKESVNLNMEKWKLPNLNNREEISGGKRTMN